MSRATRPDQSPRAGFTLLEVLVALALLAAAMAAIGSLASVGRRANRAEFDRVGLAQVARRVLADMTERNFSGGSTGAADGYRWRIDVSPMAVAPPRQSAARLSAQPSAPSGQQPQPAQQTAQQQAAQQDSTQQQPAWIPYRIVLRISGPGGASAEFVTVRLGKAAS
ncbi:MAG: prepilin-type N-terminal cleavage/methylation domain-containing protein [Rhodoblastus sp.]